MSDLELCDFAGPIDFDLRLRDHLVDEELSDQRKALAAVSMGENPRQAEILADELHFAFLLMDLDTTEGAEWVEHIRLTSRFFFQQALINLVLPTVPVHRVKDLEWLLVELKHRRQMLAFCEREGVPYIVPRLPQADVPAWWDRNGAHPLTVPFVPTGYTQRQWLDARDELAVRALDTRNDALNAGDLPF